MRRKKITDGGESLYLDIYQDGHRRYEFLKLYLVPEKNALDRKRNAETLRVAETIRSERAAQVARGRYDFDGADGTNFWTFYEDVVRDKRAARKHAVDNDVWHTTERYLRRYCSKENLRLKDITTSWCEGFFRSLKGRTLQGRAELSQNSQSVIYACFHAVMTMAYKKGLIQRIPLVGAGIKNDADTERVYLDLEELQRLANTDTPYRSLRRAFLFGCLTGLRKSDILQLRWGDVTEMDGFTRLSFSQYKTASRMYLDISEQAAQLMGERGKAADKVFDSLGSCISEQLRKWARDAGIDKDLTFHSSRHTFAVVMLTLDTDLYTVSKLLGHKDIGTTQIYAKIVDKKRREAVSKIPKLF